MARWNKFTLNLYECVVHFVYNFVIYVYLKPLTGYSHERCVRGFLYVVRLESFIVKSYNFKSVVIFNIGYIYIYIYIYILLNYGALKMWSKHFILKNVTLSQIVYSFNVHFRNTAFVKLVLNIEHRPLASFFRHWALSVGMNGVWGSWILISCLHMCVCLLPFDSQTGNRNTPV